MEQSSEFDEDVDVGVMETVLLLLLFPRKRDLGVTLMSVNKGLLSNNECSPEDPLDLLSVLGFLFLVWIPSFFMASGRGTYNI